MIGMTTRLAAVMGMVVAGLCATVGTANAQATAGSPACQVLDPELQVSYQGSCKDGMANGPGEARGLDGAYYVGAFVAGAKSGRGTKLYANGDAYTGGWRNDVRNGEGAYVFGEQSPWRGDRSYGEWVDDKRHGEGGYVFGPDNAEMKTKFFAGAPIDTGPPSIAQRQRALKVLAPVIGKPGAQVCSVTTQGSSPKHIARGSVVQVLDDRLQVQINTSDVIDLSVSKINPRWDSITDWMPC